MFDGSRIGTVVRRSLIDKKTGLPIDGIDGTQCPCPVPLPSDVQAELERNRRLDHQMVQMGKIVGGNSVGMDLPCHVHEDDRND